MKHYAICLALLLTTIVPIAGQGLPRGLTDAERQWVSEGFVQTAHIIPGELVSVGPPNAPRAMAEWEEQQALVITWAGYQSILKEIVRYAKEEVTVLIVTPNESSVRGYLENYGIDLSQHVEFVDADYNTVWVRDYGGNPVYVRGVDSLAFVDWIYNRPRPKDDLIPYAVAEHLGVPIYGTVDAPFDLVNTGGNFMSDGMGRGFSSNLVLTENGPQNVFGSSNHDIAAIDNIMSLYMGVDEYVKMPVLPYDGIHHIDMHMKIVDESTLIVGQYPDGVADGPQIEANLMYVVDQFKQRTGRDYTVVRMPMPPDAFGRFPNSNGDYRTYTNAIFVNKTILVPVYEEKYDTTGLRIWRETMPGYHIVGIDCNAIIPASGALHCITKEVGVHQPLLISHVQPGALSAGESRALQAEILHVSGILEAWTYFRIAGNTPYDSVRMMELSEDHWEAILPEFSESVRIEYYFKAVSNDGKIRTRPLVAPEGYFSLDMNTETTAVEELAGSPPGLHIYPNPAHAITCISVFNDVKTKGEVRILDIHGRPVISVHSGIFPAGESRHFLNAARLEPGNYLIVVNTEKSLQTRLLSVN